MRYRRQDESLLQYAQYTFRLARSLEASLLAADRELVKLRRALVAAEAKASIVPTVGPPPQTVREWTSALGKRGGPIGGAVRAAKLSPARRRAIAISAATARWLEAKGGVQVKRPCRVCPKVWRVQEASTLRLPEARFIQKSQRNHLRFFFVVGDHKYEAARIRGGSCVPGEAGTRALTSPQYIPNQPWVVKSPSIKGGEEWNA